jgi:hypothetical protein
MRKSLTAFAAATVITVAVVAAPKTANARWGWWSPAGYYSYPYYGYPDGYGPRYGGYGTDLAVAFRGYASTYPAYGYPYGYYGRPYYARRAYRRF